MTRLALLVALALGLALPATAVSARPACLQLVTHEQLGADHVWPVWGQTEDGRKNHAAVTQRAREAARSGAHILAPLDCR